MTITVTNAYTATGTSDLLLVNNLQSYTYTITGTFVGTWVIEFTKDQTNYETVATGTGTQAEVTVISKQSDSSRIWVRSRCSAYTSGTLTSVQTDVSDDVLGTEIIDDNGLSVFKAVDGGIEMGGTQVVTGAATFSNLTSAIRTSQQKVITSGAKVGGTAGAVVDAANDKNSLVKVPASQTGSTVVVKIPDLKVGDTITGISVYGQLESAGGAVTVDAILRAQTAVAADNTDAAIGSGITQVSKTADYLINDAETGLTHVVIDGNSYYVLLTVTTAASTDVDILGVTVTVTES